MADRIYYKTTTLCPECETLIPGEVRSEQGGVYVTRTCPRHGPFAGLVCSDVEWFESLAAFDVPPTKPARSHTRVERGCPSDCGLCPAHRQSAGTTAIELSNRCNASCPVCLADNRASFELSPAEVREIVEATLRTQGQLDVVTLSGGEPTIHPELAAILRALDRPEVGRIALNTNGIRIAEDDALLDELARHGKLYVSLHYDGANAAQLRGIDHALQVRALDRLARRGIAAVPVALAARGVNEPELGVIATSLLRRPHVRSLILSLMAYTGPRGSRFPGDAGTRLTIPAALEAIEAGARGTLRKQDFMPLPMPNPICAAVGYFLVEGEELLPIVSAAGPARVVAFLKNSHFAKADGQLEGLLRETIDRLYASPEDHPASARLLAAFRRLLGRLFPEGRPLTPAERAAIAEESIKTVYLMQFMDAWTFDSVRLAKCSCQHLLPGGRRIPSCGYYSYHRRFDPHFS